MCVCRLTRTRPRGCACCRSGVVYIKTGVLDLFRTGVVNLFRISWVLQGLKSLCTDGNIFVNFKILFFVSPSSFSSFHSHCSPSPFLTFRHHSLPSLTLRYLSGHSATAAPAPHEGDPASRRHADCQPAVECGRHRSPDLHPRRAHLL